MTQTFYGLIVLILIVTSVVPGIPSEVGKGWTVFGAGMIAAAAELFSAVFQGKICASGISLLPKTRGKILVNAMMLAVFFTIMSLNMLGLM